MSGDKLIMRVGAVAGALAAILLGAMIIVGLGVGPDLENLERSLSPTLVASLFAEHTGEIRTLMVLDDLFVQAYVVAFIGLAAYARRRATWLAWIGLGFGLLTGGLDFLENSVTLGLVSYMLPTLIMNTSPLIDPVQLLVLSIVGQMKYLCASVAIAMFGIGVWDRPLFNRSASVVLLLFVPLNAIAFISAPFANLRILGMLGLLVVGAILLWREA